MLDLVGVSLPSFLFVDLYRFLDVHVLDGRIVGLFPTCPTMLWKFTFFVCGHEHEEHDGQWSLFVFVFFLPFQVMLDTVGPELQVVNKSEKAITLKADENVILTPDQGQEASSKVLPINFAGLSKVHMPKPYYLSYNIFRPFPVFQFSCVPFLLVIEMQLEINLCLNHLKSML